MDREELYCYKYERVAVGYDIGGVFHYACGSVIDITDKYMIIADGDGVISKYEVPLDRIFEIELKGGD